MITRMKAVILGAAVFALVACDASAKNKGKDKDVAPRRLSSLHESCAAAADCAEGLRCYANACVSTDRVLVGEYYARVGDVSLAKKDLARAAEAYDEAVKQYKAKNKTVPPRLYCGWGRALLADTRDPDKPELAAKVLHRCLRGAPVGSPLRDHALRLLAQLDELGLNPVTLPSKEDATKYLKGERKPTTEKLQVKVASPAMGKRGHDRLVKLMQDPALKPRYVACWTAHYNATKKPEMSATFAYHSRFNTGPFPEQDGHYITMDKATPPTEPGEAAAFNCVKSIIEPLAKKAGIKHGSSWSANITITVAE